MPWYSNARNNPALNGPLHDSCVVTPELFWTLSGPVCRRFRSGVLATKNLQIERLMQSEAWIDAALALIELELPQWRLRRLVYDGGEWHCALSGQRELQKWLDQAIETRHPDLALAILTALIEACSVSAQHGHTGVPETVLHEGLLYDLHYGTISV
jgi:hypothetical protein